MDAHRPTPHARLLFQAVRPSAWPELFFLRAEPGARQDAPSLMAIQDGVAVETFFSECTNQLARHLAVLRSAHCVGEAPHYHHIVASNVVRATRLLSAIRECVYSGVSEAAVILARSLYELSTAFYVDWLAPEQIGPSFAFVAQIPKRDFRDALKEIASERQADGWSAHEATRASKGMLDAYELAAKVSAKAHLTPLASTHNALYRTLSGYTHQDADTAASFANYLECELDPSVADHQQFHQNVSTVMFVANRALALLLQCVGSEFPVR